MFGQSAVVAFVASNVTKRVSFLGMECAGYSRYEADKISDELSISAAYAAGTAASVITIDPIGLAGTSAYALSLEKDMVEKQKLFIKK